MRVRAGTVGVDLDDFAVGVADDVREMVPPGDLRRDRDQPFACGARRECLLTVIASCVPPSVAVVRLDIRSRRSVDIVSCQHGSALLRSEACDLPPGVDKASLTR